jgi:hypothetical protein
VLSVAREIHERSRRSGGPLRPWHARR